MKVNTNLSTDDDKFVEATLDPTKRQERIDRLSHSRRVFNIVIIIQAVGIVLQMLLYMVARYTTPPSTPDTFSSILSVGLSAFFVALLLHSDLQIKFLKAEAAREAKTRG